MSAKVTAAASARRMSDAVAKEEKVAVESAKIIISVISIMAKMASNQHGGENKSSKEREINQRKRRK